MKMPNVLVCLGDGSFKSEEESKSVRGSAYLLCHKENKNVLGGKGHLIAGLTKSITRTCKSTMTCELHAGNETGAIGISIGLLWEELFGDVPDVKTLAQREADGNLILDIDLATDCRDLFDSVRAPERGKLTEPNMGPHLDSLREDVRKGRFRRYWWCDTADMWADGLTKSSVRRAELQELMKGNYVVKHLPLQFAPSVPERERLVNPVKPPSKKKNKSKALRELELKRKFKKPESHVVGEKDEAPRIVLNKEI